MKEYAKYLEIGVRVFSGLMLLIYVFLMPYLADFYLLEPETTFQDYYFEYIDNRYYIFEIVILALAVIAILCITRRIGVSLTVVSMCIMLLAYASRIKFAARNELFRLDDLKLTEAAGMAVNFLNFSFSPVQAGVIAVVASFCSCGILTDFICRRFALSTGNEKGSHQIPIILRVFGSCICIIIMLYYGHTFINSVENEMILNGSQITNEGYDRFVLYNFLRNEKNVDVTTDDIEKSYAYFQDKSGVEEPQAANKQKPAVIVIMNESWWNTDNIVSNKISFSTDPMGPYHALAEQCSSGNLSTNIFGGGTVSSEMEFLTGINTKYLLSDVGIYTEIREHKVPSLVDYFHALDYYTTAIHPYYGTFYSRDRIYSLIGFDKVIFENSMDYTDIYTRYISDESLANQIIKEYEDDSGNADKKKFIFAVSIANHERSLDYKEDVVEDYLYPIEVSIENTEVSERSYNDFVNSVNGIYLANKAFDQLVAYFGQKKEPIIIVMYGDHNPFFPSDMLTAMGMNGNDFDTQTRQYAVPVLMWSNFNDARIEFSGENINYLSQILLEYAGLPKTDMTQILRCERNLFKVDVRRFVEDSDGQQVKVYTDEQSEMIRHINVVNYDILFGSSSHREKLWQPHGAVE